MDSQTCPSSVQAVAADLDLRYITMRVLMSRFGGRLQPADAEDIFQDVFLKLVERPAVLEQLRNGNMRGFFYTCACNKAIDYLRTAPFTKWAKVDTHAHVPGKREVEMADIEAERQTDTDTLLDILEQIAAIENSRHRKALELRCSGCTVPEIAVSMGCSLPAAKKALMRGKAKLEWPPDRDLPEHDEFEPPFGGKR